LLNSGPGEPAFNMAMDEALLEAMPRLRHPVLRFYSWIRPAASFGYFQKYFEVEQMTPLRPLVRRPTGGGLVPHAADWTYSLSFPPSHEWYSITAIESYRRIHACLQAAFSRVHLRTELAPAANKSYAGQCFSGYVQFDLLWQGKKIAGAAQRRRRDGLLIQGSVQPPAVTAPRQDWEDAVWEVLNETQRTPEQVLEPDEILQRRTQELAERKYSRPDYNQGR
jgi:lipoate-protein ligase A